LKEREREREKKVNGHFMDKDNRQKSKEKRDSYHALITPFPSELFLL
jgi:hypothetical protein